jgi:uncharacterized protein (TIGR00162 family)
LKPFEIVLNDPPEMDSPVFVEGLPGIGNVGRICAEHLISIFQGKKFGDIYSKAFPHQVRNNPDGTLALVGNGLYYSTSPRNIICLTGNMQPLPTDFESHYVMAETILDLCEDLGVELIITLGGYFARDPGNDRKVYGAASSPDIVQRYEGLDLEFLTDEPATPIVGVSGLIPAMASARGAQVLCLLGETTGSMKPDTSSASAILKRIASALEIEVDLSDLSKSSESIENEMNEIIRRIEHVENTPPRSRDGGEEGYIH